MLFEIYQRFSSVNASASRMLGALAPPMIAGLLVLLLFQVPLAWSLARRLQRGHEERERLLAGAIEAQDRERRRIAADLHDGVVQDLAGVAFGLAPLAADARRRGNDEEARVVDDAVDTLRQGVRDMRTLLVEIHPPRLESAGLEPVLDDLLSPLRAQGIETQLSVDEGGRDDALVYRVAREALRNVAAHAEAQHRHGDASRPRRSRSPTTAAASTPPERAGRAERGPRRSLAARRPGRAGRRHAHRRLDPWKRHDRHAGGPAMIRVLLADDHGVIRDGLGRLIGGLEDVELVGTAADGADAIEKAEQLQPDVVVMDLDMPRVDGIEATRRILAQQPRRTCSCSRRSPTAARILGALEAGACGYLLKDAASEDVAEGIRAAARGESPLDPRAARTVPRAPAPSPTRSPACPSASGKCSTRSSKAFRTS